MEIATEQLAVPVGRGQMGAFLARPQTPGRYPGIVVLMEIFGINSHIRDITRRLAAEGYVALAIDYFHRTAPGLDLGYGPEEVARGRTAMESTTTMGLLADVEAAIHHLQADPGVIPGRIGAVGFCFGGHVAYIAASEPRVRATASFYGAGIARHAPGGGPVTIERTPMIRGAIVCFFGAADRSIPTAECDAIAAALNTNGIDHQLYRYAKAGHGFFCDQRSSYDPAAATDAWQKLCAFFDEKLKAEAQEPEPAAP